MKKINKTLIIVVLILIIIAILITMLILKNKKNYIYHCYTLDTKYVKCIKVEFHNGFITGKIQVLEKLLGSDLNG